MTHLYRLVYNPIMDTRDALLQVSLKLFSQRGFSSVGVQEIVQEAGITKPTLYHHFGSKAGLIQAVLDQKAGPFVQAFQEAAFYRRDITQNLNQLTLTSFQWAQEAPQVIRLVMSMAYFPEDHESSGLVREFLGRLLTPLEELFVQAAEDHGNMKGRHRLFAQAFWGNLLAQTKFWILDQEAPSSPDLAYRLVHQFMHGIFS